MIDSTQTLDKIADSFPPPHRLPFDCDVTVLFLGFVFHLTS
uniref:Uncharacterized protein n=1 Tax=Anguilla anguilla TaxID=7936 RepID=A0A0E9T4P9_ANGAN